MNLFRSEEHIVRWIGARPGGRTISIAQLSELGHVWYRDRLSPGWRPHTRDQNQAVLERLGLTGDFWQLS
jgi:hypothetical protein